MVVSKIGSKKIDPGIIRYGCCFDFHHGHKNTTLGFCSNPEILIKTIPILEIPVYQSFFFLLICDVKIFPSLQKGHPRHQQFTKISSEIHQRFLFVMLISDVIWLKKKSTKNFPVQEENSALRDELLESSENNLRCSGDRKRKKWWKGGGEMDGGGYKVAMVENMILKICGRRCVFFFYWQPFIITTYLAFSWNASHIDVSPLWFHKKYNFPDSQVPSDQVYPPKSTKKQWK